MATFSDLLQGLWKQRLGQTWVNPALRADTCWEHRRVPASSPLLYHKRWAAFAAPVVMAAGGDVSFRLPPPLPTSTHTAVLGRRPSDFQSGAWDSPPVVYCRTPFPSLSLFCSLPSSPSDTSGNASSGLLLLLLSHFSRARLCATP